MAQNRPPTCRGIENQICDCNADDHFSEKRLVALTRSEKCWWFPGIPIFADFPEVKTAQLCMIFTANSKGVKYILPTIKVCLEAAFLEAHSSGEITKERPGFLRIVY